MHILQEKILKIAGEKNLGNMTLREIGALVGEKFPQKIKHHLVQLERKGLLKIDKARSLIQKTSQHITKNAQFVSVPIIGTANCGPATLYAEANYQGYLKISSRILRKRKDLFAVRASGLSMNKARINEKTIEDGDYLIIDRSETAPHNRDVVLAIVDDTAVVKRYIWDSQNKQIILASDSTKDLPPVYIHEDDNFLINGKVVQVIKRPKM